MKDIKVKCPHCHKTFSYYTSEFRPFCCEKCKLIDLGEWLSENYKVPAQNLTEEEKAHLEALSQMNHDEE